MDLVAAGGRLQGHAKTARLPAPQPRRLLAHGRAAGLVGARLIYLYRLRVGSCHGAHHIRIPKTHSNKMNFISHRSET